MVSQSNSFLHKLKAFSKHLLLIASATLTFSTLSSATSVDYTLWGSIGAHTAALTGNKKAGGVLTLTSPLVQGNSSSFSGTVTLSTGSLAATGNPNVFAFTGGSITLTSGGALLFHGTFSSGTLTLLGGSNFSLSGSLGNGTVLLSDKNGDIRGDTVITPEPGTFVMFLPGLMGLAGMLKREKRHSGYQ